MVAAKAASVGGEGALVLGAAVDVVEHAAGQPALGDAAQVVDRRGAGEATFDAVGLDRAEADDRAQGLVAGSRRARTSAGGVDGGDARPDGLERGRHGAVGAGLDEHVAEGGGLDRPGDDRQPGGVGGELAEQLVLRAAARRCG